MPDAIARIPSGPDFAIALSGLIEPLMSANAVPGVGVALLIGDDARFATFGITNIEHPLPITADTLFQAGSVTKTFTATALLRLVDAGRLDLDAPVRRYIPEFRVRDPDVSAQVTTRHLLTHAAGWHGDHYVHFGPGDDSLARYVMSFAALEQVTPLGWMWWYNNSAFGLAGRLIEVLTGATYEEAVRALVLEPLGMRRSFFFMSEAISHRFAVGHFPVDGMPVVVRPWPISRCHNSSGGLVTSLEDLVTYLRAHLGRGTSEGRLLLREATLRETRALWVPGAVDQHRAMPWIRREIDDQIILAHGGGGPRSGQKAYVALAPERDTALITLTNGPGGEHVIRAAMDWWLKAIVGVERVARAFVARPASELSAYVGLYRSKLEDLELRLDDDQLCLVTHSRKQLAERYETQPPSTPPVHVAFTGDDRLIVVDGPTRDAEGEFLRDGAGNVDWLWFDGRIYRA